MGAQPLIILVFAAQFLAVAVGDEVKVQFSAEAQERFGGRIPIEVSVVRKAGKALIMVKNVSADYVMITKHPQGWSMRYRAGGAWRDDSGSVFPVDADLLDHVALRAPKGGKSMRTSVRIFEVATEHESAEVAQAVLNLGAYFPSIRDYVEFSIVANITLERSDPVEP